jgi:hypothetical protein
LQRANELGQWLAEERKVLAAVRREKDDLALILQETRIGTRHRLLRL